MIDVDQFKKRSLMPAEDVDRLEARCPGFLLNRLVITTSRIHGRLRKLYAAPFASPVPEIVIGWLVAIVTKEAYLKRGVNASDESFDDVKQAAETAEAELREAADAVDGLFDLPLRENTTEEGRAKAGPLAYSEPSPYDWIDRQAEAIRGR